MSSQIDTQLKSLSDCYEDVSKNFTDSNVDNFKESLDEFKITFYTSSASTRSKYKKDIELYKEKLNELIRKQLMGKKEGSSVETKHDTIAILEQSRKQLEETIIVGTQTLHNLKEQEETLKRIQNKTTEVNAKLSTANKILNRLKSFFRS